MSSSPTSGPGALRHIDIIQTSGAEGYRLLDSGKGRKLERFGQIVVDRPEPQALWSPKLPAEQWSRAHAVFSASGEDDEKGKWRVDKQVPDTWPVKVGPVTMGCRLQGLWHLGLFPEQQPHWDWMLERVSLVKAAGDTPRVLNLFGYTGAASLLAAAHGAEVTHVDASKKAIQWGKDNQAASKLQNATVRWMLDDAAKFAAREVRRGRTYHVILVDPPKFGRGPDGEVWDLFTSLPPLLDTCVQLLAPERAAMVLTVYAIRASVLAFEQVMREALTAKGGTYQTGELALMPDGKGPVVPTSLFVRWAA